MRIVVAALLVLFFAGSAVAERRVALVMAADNYRKVRPLENAVNDARAIEATLEKLGFEVFIETNRDLRRMRRAVKDFSEDAAGADVALVFFAGHGVEISGENRLLPIDADAASLEALKATSLPLEEITGTVRAVAPIAIVLLDACRNDPFGVTGAGGERCDAACLQHPARYGQAGPRPRGPCGERALCIRGGTGHDRIGRRRRQLALHRGACRAP